MIRSSSSYKLLENMEQPKQNTLLFIDSVTPNLLQWLIITFKEKWFSCKNKTKNFSFEFLQIISINILLYQPKVKFKTFCIFATIIGYNNN